MPVLIVNGEIADTPTRLDDLIRVSCPDLGNMARNTYGPLKYRPYIAGNGAPKLPVRGDKATIGLDSSTGEQWIISWHHDDHTNPPYVGGGGGTGPPGPAGPPGLVWQGAWSGAVAPVFRDAPSGSFRYQPGDGAFGAGLNTGTAVAYGFAASPAWATTLNGAGSQAVVIYFDVTNAGTVAFTSRPDPAAGGWDGYAKLFKEPNTGVGQELATGDDEAGAAHPAFTFAVTAGRYYILFGGFHGGSESGVSDFKLTCTAGAVISAAPAGGGTAYAVNDAVTYLGSSYRRKVAGTTSTPPNADTTNWELIAAKGDPGPGSATYTHTQGTLAATWNVVHNLGKYPSVSVVDSGGSVVIPNVVYVDANNVTVTFGAATSGKVYCN
jgi:hypothetical protein